MSDDDINQFPAKPAPSYSRQTAMPPPLPRFGHGGLEANTFCAQQDDIAFGNIRSACARREWALAWQTIATMHLMELRIRCTEYVLDLMARDRMKEDLNASQVARCAKSGTAVIGPFAIGVLPETIDIRIDGQLIQGHVSDVNLNHDDYFRPARLDATITMFLTQEVLKSVQERGIQQAQNPGGLDTTEIHAEDILEESTNPVIDDPRVKAMIERSRKEGEDY